jgi:hypothetical protein
MVVNPSAAIACTSHGHIGAVKAKNLPLVTRRVSGIDHRAKLDKARLREIIELGRKALR